MPFANSYEEYRAELEAKSNPSLFGDAAYGLAVGAASAIEGIGEAATLFQVDIPDRLGLDPTATWAGMLTENLVQFGVGFGAVGAIGKVGKMTRFGQAVARSRVGQSIAGSHSIVRSGLKGAAADFLAFSGEDSNLSNVLEQAGVPFASWLAIDGDDSEFTKRLKVTLEGAGIGAAFDGVLHALRGVKNARKKLIDREADKGLEGAFVDPEAPSAGQALPPDVATESRPGIYRIGSVEDLAEWFDTRDEAKFKEAFPKDFDSFMRGENAGKMVNAAADLETMTSRVQDAVEGARSGDNSKFDDVMARLAAKHDGNAAFDTYRKWQKTSGPEAAIGEFFGMAGARDSLLLIDGLIESGLLDKSGRESVVDGIAASFGLENLGNGRLVGENASRADVLDLTDVNDSVLKALQDSEAELTGVVEKIAKTNAVPQSTVIDELTELEPVISRHRAAMTRETGQDYSIEQTYDDVKNYIAHLESGDWVEDLLSGEPTAARLNQKRTLMDSAKPIYDEVRGKEKRRPVVNPRLMADTAMEVIVYLERKNPDIWKNQRKKVTANQAVERSINKHIIVAGTTAAEHPKFISQLAKDAEAVEGRIMAMQAMLGHQANFTIELFDQLTRYTGEEHWIRQYSKDVFGKEMGIEEFEIRANAQLRRLSEVLVDYGRVRTASGRALRWHHENPMRALLETKIRREIRTIAKHEDYTQGSKNQMLKVARAELRKLQDSRRKMVNQPSNSRALHEVERRLSALDGITKELEVADVFAKLVKRGQVELGMRNLVFGHGSLKRQWWMFSLLSGFKTSAAAAMSSMLTRFTDPAGRVVGRHMQGMLKSGNLIAKGSPEVEKALAAELENVFNLSAWMKGAIAAFKSGRDAWKRDTQFDMLSTLDSDAVGYPPGWRGTLSRITEIPGRILTAMDTQTKMMLANGRLRSRFAALAKEEGAPDVDQFVEEHMSIAIRNEALFNAKALDEMALERMEQEIGRSRLDALDDVELEQIFTAKVEELYADDVIKRVMAEVPIAERAGQTAGFTNDIDPQTWLQQSAKGLQEMLRKVPPLVIVLPFIKAPTNMLEFARRRLMFPLINPEFWAQSATMMDYVGAIAGKDFGLRHKGWAQMGEASRQFVKDLNGHPDIAADAMGRAAFSASTLVLTVGAWQSGMITGTGPSDPRERALLEEQGWQPLSLKIGDTFISLSRLEPIGSIFGMMASVLDQVHHNVMEDDLDPLNEDSEASKIFGGLLNGVLSSFATNLKDKSYMQGVTNLIEAMSNPAQSVPDQTAKAAATFLVPNFLAQFRDITDTTTVKTWADQGFFEQLYGRLAQRLPGPTKEPASWLARAAGMSGHSFRRNFMGEEMERVNAKNPGGDWTASLFNLGLGVRINYTSDDVINEELAQLQFPIRPPKPEGRGVDLRKLVGKGGQSAYDRYLELTGTVRIGGHDLRQALTGLITSWDYKSLPTEGLAEMSIDSPRKQRIQSVVAKYRSLAGEKLESEFPELRDYFVNRAAANRALRTGEDPDVLRYRFLPNLNK